MIIYGRFSLKVGERYFAELTDKDGTFHDVAYLVLRVSNEEEYRDYVYEVGAHLRHPIPPGSYFYEVSTD